MAFSALFQLDAQSEPDVESVRASLREVTQGHDAPIEERDREKALALALAAFETRGEADAEVMALSPGWPAHRQPAADRAILRLAWHEMTTGRVGPKIAVNEAVELAKEFSTEKSPAFVNGVLDKVLKKVSGERREGTRARPGSDGVTERGGDQEDAGERG